MSSFRNAVKRIEHKERAQPSDRKKFGLLEKHKDYKERSKDFKNKQSYIKSLRIKANDRNPDEFYFKMHNSQVRQGLHEEILKDASLDQETLKLLKTQDMGYLVLKKSMEDKKIKKVMDNLHFIDSAKQTSHIKFVAVDSEEDINKFTSESEIVNDTSILKSANKKISQSYNELRQRINRTNKINQTIDKLALQRNLMGKGIKRKVTLGETTSFKWKKQRSR